MHRAWVCLSIFITVMKTLKVFLAVLGTQLPPPVAHQTFLLLFRCSFVCPAPSLSLHSYLLTPVLGATILLCTCPRAVPLDHVTEITCCLSCVSVLGLFCLTCWFSVLFILSDAWVSLFMWLTLISCAYVPHSIFHPSTVGYLVFCFVLCFSHCCE